MELTLKLGRRKELEAQPSAAQPPAYGAQGRTGTKTWAGRLFEDYKPELSGRFAVQTYDRMRRSDSQVAMTLRAMKLPVLQAKWDVVSSDEDEEMGEQIALGVKHILFAGGRRHWRSVLRHALLMLDFGFAVMEEVWERRDTPDSLRALGLKSDKMIWLASLEPRLPQTIDQWLGIDKPPYHLIEIQQILPTGGVKPPPIPAANALIFTNEREGDNYEGRAILRSAYKSWYYAEMLEKFDAIGLERASVGLPEIHYEFLDGLDVEEARKRAEEILAHLNASEQGYVVTMPGQKFDPHVSTYSNNAIRTSIASHKRDISVNAIMQFMELGANKGSGSRATASEQRGPFDLAELALADEIAETISGETIEDIVRYNWGERPGYPALQASGLLDTNMADMATVINNLVQAGALIPDTKLEDWARDLCGMPKAVRPQGEPDKQLPVPSKQTPAAPEPVVEPAAPKTAPTAAPAVDGKTAPAAPANSNESRKMQAGEFWREPSPKERHVNFRQIRYDLDQAKEDFKTRVGTVARAMAEDCATDAARAVRARDHEKLIALRPAGVDRLASKIKGELKPAVDYGRRTVRDERERARKGEPAPAAITERQQGERGYAADNGSQDLLTDEGLATWQGVKAKRKAQAIVDGIDAAVTDEGLKLIRTGSTKYETLLEVATRAAETSVARIVAQLISEAFGMGRGNEIQSQVDDGDVVKGIYSALLDGQECDPCRELDGQEFLPSEPEFEQYADGNAEGCEGGDACRCLLFLEFAGMQQPVM